MNEKFVTEDKFLAPRFLAVSEDYVPDQQNLGDAGHDLRSHIETDEKTKDWLRRAKFQVEEKIESYKKQALQSSDRYPFYPLIPSFPNIYLDGQLFHSKEHIDEKFLVEDFKTFMPTQKLYKVGIEDAEVFKTWYEELLEKLEQLEKENVLVLPPGSSSLISTGFKVALPKPILVRNEYSILPLAFELDIHARSGLAIKHGLRIKNQTGIVDTGYRDWVKVGLENTGNDIHFIKDKCRIAQAVFRLCINLGALDDYKNKLMVSESEFEMLSLDDRGGGFGSTGT